MLRTKYESVDGRDFYMCDSIPTDDITISRNRTKKITIKPNSKSDFNLELQKFNNIPGAKEEKGNKFRHDFQDLIDFYKKTRKYRDVNGNIIKKHKEEILTPYQRMIKINEEIKTLYDRKATKRRIIYPLIVKNTRYNDFNCINNLNKSNNLIKLNNNGFYKIQSFKNLSHYNNLCIKNNTSNQSKEISQIDLNKTNIKKSFSSLNDTTLNKNYCNSHKVLNPSFLKLHKDDLISNRTNKKYDFKNTINDINNWKIKLILPDSTINQHSQRENTTNNIFQDLKDYNLIQFNVNQLLKRDKKHKDKFILNTRKNSLVKKVTISDEITKSIIGYKDRNKLRCGRKGYTVNNIKIGELNEYYKQTYN